MSGRAGPGRWSSRTTTTPSSATTGCRWARCRASTRTGSSTAAAPARSSARPCGSAGSSPRPSWRARSSGSGCYEDFAAEALGQLTLARFIDSGGFARHLRRVRPIYRARRDRLLAVLDAHLPEIEPSGEAAGLHLLLRLPDGRDPEQVAALAAKHDVQLENATWHWADHCTAPPTLLVGYGAQREHALAHGIEALAAEPW